MESIEDVGKKDGVELVIAYGGNVVEVLGPAEEVLDFVAALAEPVVVDLRLVPVALRRHGWAPVESGGERGGGILVGQGGAGCAWAEAFEQFGPGWHGLARR